VFSPCWARWAQAQQVAGSSPSLGPGKTQILLNRSLGLGCARTAWERPA
jgi:hypothetical protein